MNNFVGTSYGSIDSVSVEEIKSDINRYIKEYVKSFTIEETECNDKV